MADFQISQEQLDTLLSEVSIEDKMRSQYARTKNTISKMLHRNPTRELLSIKKDLGEYIKALETNAPYSLEFIHSFKANYKSFTRNVLFLTQNYALFEHVVKLENIIGAMFYKIDEDRRRYPRFPLTTDLSLSIDGGTHRLFGSDISSVGVSFFSPVELTIGRRYDICMIPEKEIHLPADVLRTTQIEPLQLNIFRTACAFPNLLPWEQVRDIIKASLATAL